MAGAVAVSLHQQFTQLRWILPSPRISRETATDALDLSPAGQQAFATLGIDIAAARQLRRRFAYACMDWSERRPHLADALGAAFLEMALKQRWVQRDLDSRALDITRVGQREMSSRFGVEL